MMVYNSEDSELLEDEDEVIYPYDFFAAIANTQNLIFRLLQRLAVLWKKQSISFCTKHAPNQPLQSIPLQGLVTTSSMSCAGFSKKTKGMELCQVCCL